MTDRYVILTGTKCNSGDYLIRYRAKELFATLRPDREVVDYDGWLPLTDNQLDIINDSRALILMGSPSLQSQMYPGIYPLVGNLDHIKVPILTMAIGWKGRTGKWEECYRYPLSKMTRELLSRIASSVYLSSVRDYHTLSVLRSYGFNNFLVTGCAAMYSHEHIGQMQTPSKSPSKISFSLGVSFYKSGLLLQQNQRMILALRDAFPHAVVTVVFHHSVDPEIYCQTHKPNLKLLDAQIRQIDWLQREGINWLDVSGGAEGMLEHYSDCDLHVGYRVHAHILMASISRPTVLIAEDGRGIALREILGGMILDGCFYMLPGIWGSIATRLGFAGRSLMTSPEIVDDLIQQIKYDLTHGFPRILCHRASIDRHYLIMKEFIEQLP